jgi:hypothetical protein
MVRAFGNGIGVLCAEATKGLFWGLGFWLAFKFLLVW